MTPPQRLLGYEHAFDHPVTVGIVVGLGIVLLVTPALIALLSKAGKVNDQLRGELVTRYLSWIALIALIVAPVLLGAAWTMGAVCLLALFCYREYAQAVGLRGEILLNRVAQLGILATHLAALDHWPGLFLALTPLTVASLPAVAILSDRPQGYIRRVALSMFGFLLFGTGLAHLAYIANDSQYRPMILGLVLLVELNDVFAFVCGKTFGRRKLLPQTSPNKTIAGALGAIVCTTALLAVLSWYGLRGTPLAGPWHVLALGLIISIGGQLGDLMLSSIKRDVGIKDMGALIPGHGGLLDRFDSLLLVAPAVFHYAHYFRGFGLDQAERIFTGR